MKIIVMEQIFSGNLGEGWDDEYETAKSYAAFLETKLTEEVHGRYPDAEVEVSVDVQHASGCSRDLEVFVEGAGKMDFEIMSDLENVLPYVSELAWQEFCAQE